MDNILLILLIVLMLIVLLVMTILFVRISKRNDDLEKYVENQLEEKQNEQRQFNNMMMQTVVDIKNSTTKDFLGFNQKINQDFSNLTNRLNENIKESYKVNSDTLLHIQERINKIDSAQKNLLELSSDIVSLQNVLQDKKNRGTFGEIELYSILESTFGINDNRYQKQYSLPNGSIADAVLIGGPALGLICVDSKFPLENYRRIYDENNTKEEKEIAKKLFRKDVEKHLNDISSKYIIPGITSDFAYMFIPAEAVFAEIYGSFPELIDKSYELKVYLVSPTTLMAYLTAIRSIYLGQQRDEKAKEIVKELNALSIEFKRFKERTESIDKIFTNLIKVFEQFKVTSNKITNKFNRIAIGDFEEIEDSNEQDE